MLLATPTSVLLSADKNTLLQSFPRVVGTLYLLTGQLTFCAYTYCGRYHLHIYKGIYSASFTLPLVLFIHLHIGFLLVDFISAYPHSIHSTLQMAFFPPFKNGFTSTYVTLSRQNLFLSYHLSLKEGLLLHHLPLLFRGRMDRVNHRVA